MVVALQLVWVDGCDLVWVAFACGVSFRVLLWIPFVGYFLLLLLGLLMFQAVVPCFGGFGLYWLITLCLCYRWLLLWFILPV